MSQVRILPGAPGKFLFMFFGGRLRFWVTLLVLLLLLIPAGMGQWDIVIAIIIGLIVGNGFAFMRGQ